MGSILNIFFKIKVFSVLLKRIFAGVLCTLCGRQTNFSSGPAGQRRNTMKKIDNSDKIVDSIVGPGMHEWFEIDVRKASSGRSTFALFYRHGYSRIVIVSECPLCDVKTALKDFAEKNSLADEYYLKELVENHLLKKQRFSLERLNHRGWQWCPECSGLKEGRVVQDLLCLPGKEYIAAVSGYATCGLVARICPFAGDNAVEIVNGRYFRFDHDDPRMTFEIYGDNGQMESGRCECPRSKGCGMFGTLAEIHCHESFSAAYASQTLPPEIYKKRFLGEDGDVQVEQRIADWLNASASARAEHAKHGPRHGGDVCHCGSAELHSRSGNCYDSAVKVIREYPAAVSHRLMKLVPTARDLASRLLATV
ncbi:hypothetical protein A3I35_01200 [Candidatus Falkowbacteria bacterium RIFCSPLOWO2_02_FULL_45_15]|uniref:Uncharacterized protein n=2 Tax=Candidatus Falkowiibacteriota TaxID=1752728 RepID=A0A1F5S018_9BACT|nr:MAG: hypothetical protein A3I35_01200 [Candidatus Falkowbacteria bacterium RIFCSPLOWO2_02_FULL_45_15]OGF19793.1 MAG: hypothetical protein A3D54_00270 [Candidatus Falkowbacteria bacterium RIFCSPHIGHO2_02_FULL_45_15]